MLIAVYCGSHSMGRTLEYRRHAVRRQLGVGGRVARVFNKLGELKFDFTRTRSIGQLVDDIEAFAQANPNADFVLKDADLEAISAKTAAIAPPASLDFVDELTLSHFKKPSNSFAKMVFFEYVAAPRLLRSDRYEATGQCMRLFRMLKTNAQQNDADLKAELAEAVPDQALISLMTLDIVAQHSPPS